MSIVYLVRHGETDYSQDNIAQGQTDVSMNNMGFETINRISDYISTNLNIKKIFASDLLRCQQTSEIIIKKLPYSVLYQQSQLLREINLGIFEGKPIKELEVLRYASGDYNSYIPEGGESFNQLIDRVMKWFKLNYSSLDNSLIVSHCGPISILMDGAENKNDFDTNKDVFKHGNILALELFSVESFRINEVIEVSTNANCTQLLNKKSQE